MNKLKNLMCSSLCLIVLLFPHTLLATGSKVKADHYSSYQRLSHILPFKKSRAKLSNRQRIGKRSVYDNLAQHITPLSFTSKISYQKEQAKEPIFSYSISKKDKSKSNILSAIPSALPLLGMGVAESGDPFGGSSPWLGDPFKVKSEDKKSGRDISSKIKKITKKNKAIDKKKRGLDKAWKKMESKSGLKPKADKQVNKAKKRVAEDNEGGKLVEEPRALVDRGVIDAIGNNYLRIAHQENVMEQSKRSETKKEKKFREKIEGKWDLQKKDYQQVNVPEGIMSECHGITVESVDKLRQIVTDGKRELELIFEPPFSGNPEEGSRLVVKLLSQGRIKTLIVLDDRLLQHINENLERKIGFKNDTLQGLIIKIFPSIGDSSPSVPSIFDIESLKTFLSKFTSLQMLHCYHSELKNVESMRELVPILEEMIYLRRLGLDDCEVGPEGMELLVPVFKKMHHLTELMLCGNGLGPDGMKLLVSALEKNDSLLVLELGRNNLGDEGAKILVEFLSAPERRFLRELSLADNCIESDDVMNSLFCVLLQLRHLIRLDLGENGMAEERSKEFCFKLVPRLVSLRFLNIRLSGELLHTIRRFPLLLPASILSNTQFNDSMPRVFRQINDTIRLGVCNLCNRSRAICWRLGVDKDEELEEKLFSLMSSDEWTFFGGDYTAGDIYIEAQRECHAFLKKLEDEDTLVMEYSTGQEPGGLVAEATRLLSFESKKSDTETAPKKVVFNQETEFPQLFIAAILDRISMCYVCHAMYIAEKSKSGVLCFDGSESYNFCNERPERITSVLLSLFSYGLKLGSADGVKRINDYRVWGSLIRNIDDLFDRDWIVVESEDDNEEEGEGAAAGGGEGKAKDRERMKLWRRIEKILSMEQYLNVDSDVKNFLGTIMGYPYISEYIFQGVLDLLFRGGESQEYSQVVFERFFINLREREDAIILQASGERSSDADSSLPMAAADNVVDGDAAAATTATSAEDERGLGLELEDIRKMRMFIRKVRMLCQESALKKNVMYETDRHIERILKWYGCDVGDTKLSESEEELLYMVTKFFMNYSPGTQPVADTDGGGGV